MRITNKIMQNNSLTNINSTKESENNLSIQMSTGKKNVRPSDDPVSAIRGLKLRSNVTQITQYYGNNIPDANAWLTTTSDALGKVSDVLQSMTVQYNKGVNQYLTSADRTVISQQLKALQKEVYATGDADYAGRYVFTGYRTEVSLMFDEDTEQTYEITEQLTADDLRSGFHVDTTFVQGDSYVAVTPAGTEDPSALSWYELQTDGTYALSTDTAVDPAKTYYTVDSSAAGEKNLADFTQGTEKKYTSVAEQDINNMQYYRMRLSYKDLDTLGEDGFTPVINYCEEDTSTTPSTHSWKTLTATDAYLSTDIPNPYDLISDDANADKIFYLKDTGELLIGKNVYEKLAACKDNPDTTDADEGKIHVTYRKTKFAEGDLRPQHYFCCRTAGEDGTLENLADSDREDILNAALAGTGKSSDLLKKKLEGTMPADSTLPVYKDIIYNATYLDPNVEKQIIEYDVSFNQRLQVNTTADEAFNPGVVREVDDILRALEDMDKVENVKNVLGTMLENATEAEKPELQKLYDAAEKAYTLARENLKNLFGSGITAIQNYLDQVNVATTNSGARAARLDLVKSRMMDQKTTFEELKSTNEDVDIAETAVKLQSAEMTYNASLMATSKIMKTSLMDYI
ncbi:MAG: hypothetical protein IJ589_09725 [Lachnospiraceae bacterium]|nr:hypothetical protein [Lachnospiraceae bacterium]